MVILKKGSQFPYLNFNFGDFTEASRSEDYAISEKPSFGKRLAEIPQVLVNARAVLRDLSDKKHGN